MCVFGCEYKLMSAMYSNNPEQIKDYKPDKLFDYKEWLRDAAQNTAKDNRSLAEQKGWLTQDEIDRLEQAAKPKTRITFKNVLFVLLFAVGCWIVWLAWQLAVMRGYVR